MSKRTFMRCLSLVLAAVMLLSSAAVGFFAFAEGEQEEAITLSATDDEYTTTPEPPQSEVSEEPGETPIDTAQELKTPTDLDAAPLESETELISEDVSDQPQEPEEAVTEEAYPSQPDEPPVDESLYDRFHVWSMDDEISMTGTIELLDAEGSLIQALTWEDETVTVPNVAKLVFHAPKERPRVVLQLVRSKEYELLSYEEYKDGEAVEIEPMTGTLYEIWFGRAEEDVEARKEESLPTRGTKNLRGASSPYDSRWDNVTVGQQLTDYPWKLTGTTTVPGQWGGNDIDWWNEGGAAAFYFSVADGTLRDREVSLWITDSWSEYRYAWNRDYICSHSQGYCLWGGKAIPRTGWIGTAFLKITKIENGWAYLGASNENMANGAAVLSQTSIPIGGINTNAVIAGHRGYGGYSYFRYIEVLEEGDEVIITNLWKTLRYKVSEIRIVTPDDVDAILIQPGKDIITLLTCHPYASGGKYRYLVFCERATD